MSPVTPMIRPGHPVGAHQRIVLFGGKPAGQADLLGRNCRKLVGRDRVGKERSGEKFLVLQNVDPFQRLAADVGSRLRGQAGQVLVAQQVAEMVQAFFALFPGPYVSAQ